MSRMRDALARHRIATYCIVTFVFTWSFWFATVYPTALPLLEAGENPLSGSATMLLVGAGMLFPAIGVVVTRLVTGEGFRGCWIRPHDLRRTWKCYLAGWLGPIALVAAGAALFFLVFPGDFDPSMSGFIETTREQAAATGQHLPASNEEIRAIAYAQLALVFAAPLLNFVACFGEEWGWRGYLLSHLMERHSSTFTIVASGIVWGLWHAPITILGHNYGIDYAGWPFLGIGAMCVFTICVGTIFSWLTLRAKSCIPAVFAHGALNGCAAAPTMFVAQAANPFIGPAPTGIIGGAGFIVVAIICLIALRKRGSWNKLDQDIDH